MIDSCAGKPSEVPEGRRASRWSIDGRCALVTGGGRGLGKAMATTLAEEGARVAILDVAPGAAAEAADELEGAGGHALGFEGDVTSDDDVQRALADVAKEWGRLDILVNNAGFGTMVDAVDLPVEEFRRVYEVHVLGAFTCSKAAFPLLAERGGSIINIASVAGQRALSPGGHAHYCSAKGAVILLTQSLAVEWVQHGIRVNAIAPGFMLAEPLRALREADAARWDGWMSRIPMGRPGDPEELAGAAVYLASDASSYVTGSVLVVDGGFTCH